MERDREEQESAGYRHARLESLILDELRALMRDDVSDPRLAGVRIVAVVLSADYRNARVHYVVGSEDERESAINHALMRATPFLRARLADAIDLKRLPDLRFVLDGVASS